MRMSWRSGPTATLQFLVEVDYLDLVNADGNYLTAFNYDDRPMSERLRSLHLLALDLEKQADANAAPADDTEDAHAKCWTCTAGDCCCEDSGGENAIGCPICGGGAISGAGHKTFHVYECSSHHTWEVEVDPPVEWAGYKAAAIPAGDRPTPVALVGLREEFEAWRAEHGLA